MEKTIKKKKNKKVLKKKKIAKKKKIIKKGKVVGAGKRKTKKVIKKRKTVKRGRAKKKGNPPSLKLRRTRKRKPSSASSSAKDTADKKATAGKAKIKDNVRGSKIMIVGIGGGGCSIINEIAPKLKKSEFCGGEHRYTGASEIS
jgi:hypothetical protein